MTLTWSRLCDMPHFMISHPPTCLIDIDDGLHDRILLQLAFELHKALPRIMKGHPLKYMWAYKYHDEYTGINTHADEAAVNVNIWLTPDGANLDPTSGGLVIFTAKVS
jgi:hypothetical protein